MCVQDWVTIRWDLSTGSDRPAPSARLRQLQRGLAPGDASDYVTLVYQVSASIEKLCNSYLFVTVSCRFCCPVQSATYWASTSTRRKYT